MAKRKHDALPELLLVRLDDLSPSRHQNRSFPETPDRALVELSESIGAQGVLEPVIVREASDLPTPYELIAGERRARAARLAGLLEVPAILKEVDDDTAAEMTLAENIHRDDLTPMEEARGVSTMLTLRGGDHASVADSFRVPVAWVARRARLLDLSSTWKAAASDPDSPVHRWSANQLEVIARVAWDEQERLYSQDMRFRLPINPKVKDLEEHVASHLRRLAAAGWDLDDDGLLTGRPACSSCCDRTSRQPLLFEELRDDEEKVGDRCTNRPCWDRKADAHVEVLADALPADGIRVHTGHYWSGNPGPSLVKGSVNMNDLKKVTKSRGGRACLIVDGPERGKKFYGVTRDSAAGESDGVAKPKTLSERIEKLERRRWSLVAGQVQQLLCPERPKGAAGEGWEKPAPRELSEIPPFDSLVRTVASVGTTREWARPGSEWSKLSYHSSVYTREFIQMTRG